MTPVLRLLAAALVALVPHAAAEEEKSLDEILEVLGGDFESAEIRSQKVAEGLHVIFGLGGNILVSIGDQGVLIVDDQFPELMPRIEREIAKLGGKGVDFAINTHWHFDHTQGNLTLGPLGTWIVSQANSREMMTRSHIVNLVVAR